MADDHHPMLWLKANGFKWQRKGKVRKKGYDEKCEELAKYFLADFKFSSPETVGSLAQHIQDTVENWFLCYEQDHEAER
jgi:hypothetical protein